MSTYRPMTDDDLRAIDINFGTNPYGSFTDEIPALIDQARLANRLAEAVRAAVLVQPTTTERLAIDWTKVEAVAEALAAYLGETK